MIKGAETLGSVTVSWHRSLPARDGDSVRVGHDDASENALVILEWALSARDEDADDIPNILTSIINPKNTNSGVERACRFFNFRKYRPPTGNS